MMTEDLPMFDAYNADDAEMVEEDGFDYEMQEEPIGGEPQEYDMNGDDYGDAIPAEPTMTVPAVDVPITEEADAAIDVTVVPQSTPSDILPVVASLEPVPSSSHGTSIAPLDPTPILPIPSTSFFVDHSPKVTATLAITIPHPEPPTIVVSPALHEHAPQSNATATEYVEVPPTVTSNEAHEVGSHDNPPQNEAVVQSLDSAANPSADSVPPISFYFETQIFSLFSATHPESDLPVLLPGRHDLYTLPLTQLLREIKEKEAATFPGAEECVLGLEYQELDLCIDENCKYAGTYKLEDLCNALLACNHTAIEFNIFLISDFEQSLSERLKGITPQNILKSESNVPQEEYGQRQDEEALKRQETQEDTKRELPQFAGDAPEDQGDSSTAHIPKDETSFDASHNAEAEVGSRSGEIVAPQEPEAGKEGADNGEADDQEDSEDDDEKDEPELELANTSALTDTHNKETGVDTAERTAGEVNAFPQYSEGQAQADPEANESPASTATLESSNHGGGQTAPQTEDLSDGGGGIEELDHAGTTEQGDDGEYYEEATEDYYEAEHENSQTSSVDSSLALTAAPAGNAEDGELGQGSTSEHHTVDGAAIQDTGDEAAFDSAELNEPSISSSPLTDEDDYGEYDEVEPEGGSVYEDSKLTTAADHDHVAPEGSWKNRKISSPPHEGASVKGKRSLDEIDLQDTDEYGDEAEYGVDTKRPRIQ